MRQISGTLLNNLRQEEYIPVILVEIDVTEIGVFRYTTWSEMINYGSNDYMPRGINFDSIRYGSSSVVDSVNLKIDDIDRSLYVSFAGRGSEPFPTSITLAVLNSVGAVIAASSIFIGTVSEWNYQPGFTQFRVVSILEQWSKVPTSVFSGSCRWNVFKGVECKYSGSQTACERTYTQCEQYGNTNNFGGFRWVQSLEGKTIVP